MPARHAVRRRAAGADPRRRAALVLHPLDRALLGPDRSPRVGDAVIKNALPALAIAVGGVGLAWLVFKSDWWWLSFAIAGIAALIGLICNDVGSKRLGKHPVSAARIMEWRFLMPFAVGAAGAAALIAFGVWFEPDENASVETKKFLAASFAALTAFITAVAIKSGEEAVDKWVGQPIKSAFQKTFKGRFPKDPTPDTTVHTAWMAVFNDEWGAAAGRRVPVAARAPRPSRTRFQS